MVPTFMTGNSYTRTMGNDTGQHNLKVTITNNVTGESSTATRRIYIESGALW